jgi:hypothetical protein
MLNPNVPLPGPPQGGAPPGVVPPVPPGPLPPQAPTPPPLPQAPPQGGILPVVGHLDYQSRYQDPQLDPYQGDYADLMDVFAVPPQGAATAPAQLTTQVGDSTVAGTPSAFLLLVEDPLNPLQSGQVMCFHRITKFPARLGHRSPWDNQFFAFSANNHGPQITTVIWRNDFLSQANNGALIRVPTEVQADTECSVVPAPIMLGPYGNNDAGTETIRTRRAMIVPPMYIRLFLSTPLSPIDAYRRFRAASLANGHAADLLPLSIWLRAAITRAAAQGAVQQPSTIQDAGPHPPLADEALHRFTWSALTSDLPGVDPGTQVNTGLTAVAGNLGTLVHEQRLSRMEAANARAASAAPKTVASFFRTRLDKLMRFCGVVSPNDLPPVYQDLANCKAKDLTQTMQDALEIAAEDLRLGHLFVMTPSLAKKIVNVSWAMVSMDDLDTGIHHFHVVQQSPEGMAAARHLVSTYELLHGEGTSLSLDDAERLATVESTSIPLSWIQARHTIGNLVLLCHVFLGTAHPLTQNLVLHFHTMVSKEIHLEHMMAPTATTVPRHLLPCYYTRWQQIRFSRWFSRQMVSPSPVPAPDFNALLEDIEDKSNWLPDFPAHYIPTSRGAQPVITPPAATPPAVPPSPRVPPAGSGAGASPQPTNTRIDNTAFNDTLFGRFRSLPGCTMPLLRARWAAATPPIEQPSSADGSRPRCLAFHVRGLCNSICRRSSDHIPATAADDAILAAFCTQHWHL